MAPRFLGNPFKTSPSLGLGGTPSQQLAQMPYINQWGGGAAYAGGAGGAAHYVTVSSSSGSFTAPNTYAPPIQSSVTMDKNTFALNIEEQFSTLDGHWKITFYVNEREHYFFINDSASSGESKPEFMKRIRSRIHSEAMKILYDRVEDSISAAFVTMKMMAGEEK